MEEEKEQKVKIYTHQPNFQTNFVRSNCDITIGGSAMGVGKTFAALLMAAEPSLDPSFRMLFIRKTLNDSKVAGSGTDDGMRLYKGMATLKLSDNPRITFNNGSFIDFTHMNNEDPNAILERSRGWQYSAIYWDEGTGYQWNTFKTVMGRNRGHGNWTGKIRLTCNPKKTHWLRVFCDWWIDPATGFVIPERDGMVRYMYLKGERVEDCVFGDTKKEVYDKCKRQIDGILDKVNKNGGNKTYESLIKSVVFYSGVITDNQEMLKENPNYIGSVATMGEKLAMANLQGCWNVDPEVEDDLPISTTSALEVFNNDPQINGDRWITCDLADVGKDNTVALVWDGFHVIDIVTRSTTTPRENAQLLLELASKYNIGTSHIIYDRTNATYMYDYIPEAVGFLSCHKSCGKDSLLMQSLKDECYWRLVYIIKYGYLSFDKDVANRRYYHKKMKQDVSVKTEFLDECSVVRFKTLPGGRMKLWSKDKMNEMLGKDRSMDLLDPCAMRMYPVLQYNKGEELASTIAQYDYENDNVQHGNPDYGDSDFDGFVINE